MVVLPSFPTFHGMNAEILCEGLPAAALAAAPGANAQTRPAGLAPAAAAPGAAPLATARTDDAAEESPPEAPLEERDEVFAFFTASESSNSSFWKGNVLDNELLSIDR